MAHGWREFATRALRSKHFYIFFCKAEHELQARASDDFNKTKTTRYNAYTMFIICIASTFYPIAMLCGFEVFVSQINK
jgi:hypothetical protein